MLQQFLVNARCFHRGGTVPVRACLAAEGVLNTPWLILGYVPVLGDALQALKGRSAVLESTLRTASANSTKSPSRNKLSTKRKDANKSSGYATCVELRQTCLAHLLRHGERPAKRKDPRIAKCDARPHKELQRLSHMPKVPPTVGGENMFAMRFIRLASKCSEGVDDACKLTRSLIDRMYPLRLSRKEDEVAATNTHTKYLPCLATLWQKANSRTTSEKEEGFAEQIQVIHQNFRLLSKSIFCSVDSMTAFFTGINSETAWIKRAKLGPVRGDGKIA